MIIDSFLWFSFYDLTDSVHAKQGKMHLGSFSKSQTNTRKQVIFSKDVMSDKLQCIINTARLSSLLQYYMTLFLISTQTLKCCLFSLKEK